jgi:hypothetical protein
VEEHDVEKLRYTTSTAGWALFAQMLEQAIVSSNRRLIVTPEQRTAGYLEALMFVLAWPRNVLKAHDEEKASATMPVEERGVGDPYQTINS